MRSLRPARGAARIATLSRNELTRVAVMLRAALCHLRRCVENARAPGAVFDVAANSQPTWCSVIIAFG